VGAASDVSYTALLLAKFGYGSAIGNDAVWVARFGLGPVLGRSESANKAKISFGVGIDLDFIFNLSAIAKGVDNWEVVGGIKFLDSAVFHEFGINVGARYRM
jgi:hypothetical protein